MTESTRQKYDHDAIRSHDLFHPWQGRNLEAKCDAVVMQVLRYLD